MNTESLNFADYKNNPQELIGRWVKVSYNKGLFFGYDKIKTVFYKGNYFIIYKSKLAFNNITGKAFGTTFSCDLIPTPITETPPASNFDKAECLWQDLKGIVMIAESGRLLTPEEIQICNDCLKNNVPVK